MASTAAVRCVSRRRLSFSWQRRPRRKGDGRSSRLRASLLWSLLWSLDQIGGRSTGARLTGRVFFVSAAVCVESESERMSESECVCVCV